MYQAVPGCSLLFIFVCFRSIELCATVEYNCKLCVHLYFLVHTSLGVTTLCAPREWGKPASMAVDVLAHSKVQWRRSRTGGLVMHNVAASAVRQKRRRSKALSKHVMSGVDARQRNGRTPVERWRGHARVLETHACCCDAENYFTIACETYMRGLQHQTALKWFEHVTPEKGKR